MVLLSDSCRQPSVLYLVDSGLPPSRLTRWRVIRTLQRQLVAAAMESLHVTGSFPIRSCRTPVRHVSGLTWSTKRVGIASYAWGFHKMDQVSLRQTWLFPPNDTLLSYFMTMAAPQLFVSRTQAPETWQLLPSIPSSKDLNGSAPRKASVVKVSSFQYFIAVSPYLACRAASASQLSIPSSFLNSSHGRPSWMPRQASRLRC